MNTDSEPFEALSGSSALTQLRIRRAIAQAQDTCQSQGQQSRACELTWDHALTLQVERFCQNKKQD